MDRRMMDGWMDEWVNGWVGWGMEGLRDWGMNAGDLGAGWMGE